MTSVVGERGQVTIPKQLRDRLGIRPGELVEFSQENDRLVLRKADQMARIMSVYGTLKLPGSVDELIEEMRGPADLPPEP
jgi:antitoxin PrlF